MADDQKYTFPEDVNASEYNKGAVTGGTENIRSIVTSKWFLTAVGVVAVVFFIMIKRAFPNIRFIITL